MKRMEVSVAWTVTTLAATVVMALVTDPLLACVAGISMVAGAGIFAIVQTMFGSRRDSR